MGTNRFATACAGFALGAVMTAATTAGAIGAIDDINRGDDRHRHAIERGYFRSKAWPDAESRVLLPWGTQEDQVCFDFDTNRHGRPRARVYIVPGGAPCFGGEE